MTKEIKGLTYEYEACVEKRIDIAHEWEGYVRMRGVECSKRSNERSEIVLGELAEECLRAIHFCEYAQLAIEGRPPWLQKITIFFIKILMKTDLQYTKRSK